MKSFGSKAISFSCIPGACPETHGPDGGDHPAKYLPKRTHIISTLYQSASDYETYMSADDLRINLWNFEITNQSFSILSLGPITSWLESRLFQVWASLGGNGIERVNHYQRLSTCGDLFPFKLYWHL